MNFAITSTIDMITLLSLAAMAGTVWYRLRMIERELERMRDRLHDLSNSLSLLRGHLDSQKERPR